MTALPSWVLPALPAIGMAATTAFLVVLAWAFLALRELQRDILEMQKFFQIAERAEDDYD